MLYYKFRPFSELSIKELLYSEIFFTSTDECNDPFDSKAFYEFDKHEEYWVNLIKLISQKVAPDSLSSEEIRKIAISISERCPMTYQEALNLDISEICYDAIRKKSITICRNISTYFSQFLELYKPECSYFSCFSKVNNEALMWSHYASQHQGFCLIFKPIGGKLQQCQPYKKKSIRRYTPNGIGPETSYQLPDDFIFQDVIYHKDATASCGFHRLPAAVIGKELSDSERLKLIKEQSEQFLQKDVSWEYEQETRVSITLRASWILGETLELTHSERLFYYEPTQLVGIIFGARMPQGNKNRLLEVLFARQQRNYQLSNYERIIFDFAIFNAHLSNKNREIQIEIEKIISPNKVYEKTDKNFSSIYKNWTEGRGFKFSQNKSSRVQVLS